jgi:hypothetical protein
MRNLLDVDLRTRLAEEELHLPARVGAHRWIRVCPPEP